MSMVAATILLGLLVAGLIKTRWVRASGAVACVAFGVVLAASPVGPAVTDALAEVGGWAYTQLQTV